MFLNINFSYVDSHGWSEHLTWLILPLVDVLKYFTWAVQLMWGSDISAKYSICDLHQIFTRLPHIWLFRSQLVCLQLKALKGEYGVGKGWGGGGDTSPSLRHTSACLGIIEVPIKVKPVMHYDNMIPSDITGALSLAHIISKIISFITLMLHCNLLIYIDLSSSELQLCLKLESCNVFYSLLWLIENFAGTPKTWIIQCFL